MTSDERPRCVITGASGLLGTALQRTLSQTQELESWSRRHAPRIPNIPSRTFDLRDAEKTQNELDRFKPETIIHTAAWTNVDACEDDPDEARRLHVDATRHLARWAAESGAHFIYISTDSVFDGQKGLYTEEDPAHPLNVYAETKREGEGIVEEISAAHLILRVNFYGVRGYGDQPSLAEWLLQAMPLDQPITLFKDVIFNPLWSGDVATLVAELMERRAGGLFHLGSQDAVSKADFAAGLARVFHIPLKNPNIISVDEFRYKAPRPKNTSLRVDKITHFLGHPMPTTAEGLDHFQKDRSSGN